MAAGNADQFELRMNLVAVKRVDPYAKEIIHTSSHVAFYIYSEENQWEKTDVEGAFFIYSRNAEPFHSIFVNNRLNTNSLIEPITGDFETQNLPPFLLYRNERTRIRGLWFYNTAECDRIADIINKLVKDCDKTKIIKNPQMDNLQKSQTKKSVAPQTMMAVSNNNNNNNVDIFSMLFKAQEDFNNSQITLPTAVNTNSKKSAAVAVPRSKPSGIETGGLSSLTLNNHQPDVTSQSVMNFFAAAKPNAPTHTEVPLFRMLSNPVHVEQIEKQQRVKTPQEGKISPNGYQNAVHELGSSPLATFLNSSNLSNVRNCNPINATDLSDIESRQKPLHQLLKKSEILTPSISTATPVKPALLLPTMFVSPSSGAKNNNNIISSSKENSNNIPVQQKQQVKQQQHHKHSNQDLMPLVAKPEPLTQSQLLQAMSYLIKNDPGFVKKLHEAYLKSFTEMVSL